MLLNSILTISSKAISRYPTGIAVTSKGLWGGSPAASDAIAFAGNGSPIAVFISALASAARVTPYTFYIDARNNGGSINSPTSRQYSDAWIGAGLNGAQFASLSS
jgi:hypothetical protein